MFLYDRQNITNDISERVRARFNECSWQTLSYQTRLQKLHMLLGSTNIWSDTSDLTLTRKTLWPHTPALLNLLLTHKTWVILTGTHNHLSTYCTHLFQTILTEKTKLEFKLQDILWGLWNYEVIQKMLNITLICVVGFQQLMQDTLNTKQ